MKKESVILIFYLLVFISCESRVVTDYDKACEVFDSFQRDNLEFSAEQLLQKMEGKAGSRSDVYVAWVALVNMEASDRYPVFKVVAEEQLGSSWKCESMKNLAPSWE